MTFLWKTFLKLKSFIVRRMTWIYIFAIFFNVWLNQTALSLKSASALNLLQYAISIEV